MNQPQPQAAEPKKPVPLQMSEHTYFVMVNDDYEKKAATAYVKSLYPGTAAKVVADLRLDRLTDKHTVIALRRPTECTPAVALRINPQGIRETSITPVDALMREVQESEPVHCAEHWRAAREGNDGELDISGFATALGTRCIPAAIKYYPRDGILRLGFA
jgi:hypothetical protein